MNRGQLRTAIETRLAIVSSGDGLLSTTALNDIIGFALRDISAEHDWPWLLTSDPLTFTDNSAPVPTGYVKARELVMNSKRAKYVPLAEFLDLEAMGTECVWTDAGATIRITPTPSSTPTATLWYIRQEPALESDSSEPLLPDAHHQALVARAAYHANTRRGRMEEALRDDNEYQLSVRKMKDASWGRSGPRAVRAAGNTYWARW